MKKFKLIIFILLVVSFILTLLYGIFGTSISLLSINEIKKDRKLNQNLIDEIKINNVDTVYDKNNNIYYYTLPESYENIIYILKLEIEGNYKYKIVNETLNIVKINYIKPIDIIIYNDKYYYETKIQITNLPLINIQTQNIIDLNYENSIFSYINQKETNKKFISNSKIKVRGATTKYYDKKPYRINFYSDRYTKETKISFSKFYMGDSLILDALYRDSSKIRNLMSTELWNDISNDFTEVKIYSEFIELFINNEYKGLYILTEPINKTKLNLNKSTDNDSSFIIKSTLGQYEVKYPNDEKFFYRSIEITNTIISEYLKNGTNSTYEVIKNTFDLKNYVDIILFNCFINNLDNNLVQNVYYYNGSLNSKKIFVHPWDMEWSFGITPQDNSRDSKIFDCTLIHPNAPEINKLLIKRYKELRKTILTKKYFDNKLDKYLNEINKGAAKRDSDKWYEYDVEKEIEDIRIWIYNRLDYMDEYIEGLENE